MKRLTKPLYYDEKRTYAYTFFINNEGFGETALRLDGASLKLGKLEDIEEKMKCPLDIFLQIFSKGVYVKSDCTQNKIEHWSPQEIKVIDAGCQWDICNIKSRANKYVGSFNYKKTWALTKEELE